MEENPYQAPSASSTDYPSDDSTAVAVAESRKVAVRRIRFAVLIGLVAPSLELGVWLSYAVQHLNRVAVDPTTDAELYSIVVGNFRHILVEEGAKLIAALVAGWWLAYPVFNLVSSLARHLFFSGVPKLEWRLSSNSALWPLPFAAIGGVITWIVYAHIFPYGWLNDVVCGTVGYLLGAWCSLTVLFSWVKVARAFKSRPPVTGI